jgi:hypothetical protein
MHSLDQLRSDFERKTNRAMSMPIAGLVIWALIGALSLVLSYRNALVAMFAATGAIFPLAVMIAKLRREELTSSANPLAKLMGMCILMVNLLWAVHLPLYFGAPDFVPLSLGIALGLHWIVYSWIIQHPLGVIHAVLRTALLLVVWQALPRQRILATSLVIVLVYAISLIQMQRRRIASY